MLVIGPVGEVDVPAKSMAPPFPLTFTLMLPIFAAPLKKFAVIGNVGLFTLGSGSASRPKVKSGRENVKVSSVEPSPGVFRTRGVEDSVNGGLFHVAQVAGTVLASTPVENAIVRFGSAIEFRVVRSDAVIGMSVVELMYAAFGCGMAMNAAWAGMTVKQQITIPIAKQIVFINYPITKRPGCAD